MEKYRSKAIHGWWGDSLTRPRLDFLDVVQRVVGRFSYSPRAGLCLHHSARGGDILLLAPCWSLSSSFGAWYGDSLTDPVLDSLVIVLEIVWSFAGRGVSLTRPVLNLSVRSSGRESLLHAPCSTCLFVRPVGSLSYTPRAQHVCSFVR